MRPRPAQSNRRAGQPRRRLPGPLPVSRSQFRHGLYQGGRAAVLKREVFERGHRRRRSALQCAARRGRADPPVPPGSYVAGRHPFTWEIVAGIIEDGESAEDLARREAVEEASLEVREVIPIHDVIFSPGACSECCVIFLGHVDTTNAGGIFGLESEGENILVKVLPFAEVRTMLEHGEIDNAIGVIALQWLALHRDEVRARWR